MCCSRFTVYINTTLYSTVAPIGYTHKPRGILCWRCARFRLFTTFTLHGGIYISYTRHAIRVLCTYAVTYMRSLQRRQDCCTSFQCSVVISKGSSVKSEARAYIKTLKNLFCARAIEDVTDKKSAYSDENYTLCPEKSDPLNNVR